jgi:hypothetical protein
MRYRLANTHRFMPNGTYAPLETALVQINAWLLRCYEGR